MTTAAMTATATIMMMIRYIGSPRTWALLFLSSFFLCMVCPIRFFVICGAFMYDILLLKAFLFVINIIIYISLR